MNKGVEILIKRMDSHPEEFKSFDAKYGRVRVGAPVDRWYSIISELIAHERTGGVGTWEYTRFMSDEERVALLDKYNEVQGDGFTAAMCEALLQDPTEEERDRAKQQQDATMMRNGMFKHSGLVSGQGIGGGGGAGQYTISTGTMSPVGWSEMQQQQEEMRSQAMLDRAIAEKQAAVEMQNRHAQPPMQMAKSTIVDWIKDK